MKKLKFLLLLGLPLLCGEMRGQVTYPFPVTNAQWIVKETLWDPFGTINYYHHFKYKRDTIINAKQYGIIGVDNYINNDRLYDYAIRTDETNKVWFIYLNHLLGYVPDVQDSCVADYDMQMHPNVSCDSTEYLLYDFNAQLNDTITIFYPWCCAFAPSGGWHKIYVTSTGTMLLNGQDRKVLMLENVTHQYPMLNYLWVEGVGSLNSPVYTEMTSELEHWFNLKTFINGNDTLIGAGINIVSSAKAVSVFPNPVVDESILEIKHNSDEIYKAEIYNEFGVYVKVLELSNSKAIIRRSDFVPGIYFVKINTNTGYLTCKKIIIY